MKSRGFPFEYYRGEVLTEAQASENRKMVSVYLGKLPKRSKKQLKKLYFYLMLSPVRQ